MSNVKFEELNNFLKEEKSKNQFNLDDELKIVELGLKFISTRECNIEEPYIHFFKVSSDFQAILVFVDEMIISVNTWGLVKLVKSLNDPLKPDIIEAKNNIGGFYVNLNKYDFRKALRFLNLVRRALCLCINVPDKLSDRKKTIEVLQYKDDTNCRTKDQSKIISTLPVDL